MLSCKQTPEVEPSLLSVSLVALVAGRSAEVGSFRGLGVGRAMCTQAVLGVSEITDIASPRNTCHVITVCAAITSRRSLGDALAPQ